MMFGCGPMPTMDLPTHHAKTEQELNAEIAPDMSVMDTPDATTYDWPKNDFGIKQSVYDAAHKFYVEHPTMLNRRYAVVIDMSMNSAKRRLVLLDLKLGTGKNYRVAHGAGSDPDNDGYATKFSNEDGSHMTSLGAYITKGTYIGSHGRSLRIDGQEKTNSNAIARAVVVHGSAYVSENNTRTGRSWGCPAMDDDVVQGVIDKIRGGSLLYIGH